MVQRRLGSSRAEVEWGDVLELQGLTRRYGELVALDDLSFTVAEGQMFGFVGPNGAGKTTAMRIVLGVLEADRGEVRWRGRPVDVETAAASATCPRTTAKRFFDSAQACSHGGSTHAKRGERARYRRTRSRPPGGAGNRLHDGWVVSLGVHGDALEGADAAQVHVELVRADLLDGLV
jgi:energy-coupling factor transporter ATP-binding protein EcfA2